VLYKQLNVSAFSFYQNGHQVKPLYYIKVYYRICYQ